MTSPARPRPTSAHRSPWPGPRPVPDPGLFGPGSVSWRLHGDPVLVMGGLRALMLQSMHPDVVLGFVQNSGYQQDWWGRLNRTAEYVGLTTFGTRAEIDAVARRVRYAHATFRFTDADDGRERRLDEPELLLWVHCALVDSIVHVARRSGLELTGRDADTYLAEQVRFAELVGLDPTTVPDSEAALADYMQDMAPVLRLDAAGKEAISSLLAPPLRPVVELATPARLGWSTLAGITFATLPPAVLALFPAAFRAGPSAVPPQAVSAALRTIRLTGQGVRAVVPALRRSPMENAARRRLGIA
ncbi:oxygenase MpaB family protein [Jannaschia sp. R86511]|uniref:oxygenase MpaB family protein n=1 Tax=Jannaschia sp. R86511 TaxID=3093853 RepID=UPI0036D3DAFB